MKRLLYVAALLVVSQAAMAQDNSYESLSRLFSQSNPQGSARMQAMGGNHSAIGADISNITGNPAGLGFYTRSELSITPQFNQITNSSQYLNNTQNSNASQFSVGNLSAVFAGKNRNPVYSGGWQGGAWGLGYSRQNLFKSSIRFGGRNNQSSMADYFAELANNEATGSSQGVVVDDFRKDLENNGSVFDYPTSMFYYGLLIDPTTRDGYPYVGTEQGKAANQSFLSTSTGFTSSWNLSYGANYRNKLYVGLGLSLARMNYTNTKTMNESFENAAAISGFSYTNDLTTSGNGFTLKGGLIYRPNDVIRLGVSVTSPTWYTISESAGQSLQTSLARPFLINAETNPEYTNNLPTALRSAGYGISYQGTSALITSVPNLSILPFESRYRLRTPMRLNGGVGIFFGKSGFISADAEYVGYSGMKLSSNDNNADGGLRDGYYTGVIKRTYRNVVNLKVGGEYRISNVSVRAGASYYQDPYQQIAQFNNLDRSRVVYSGGVGYKTNNFYIDGTVLYSQQNSAYSPYILADATTYASARIKNQTTSAVLTIGTYF
ncbi:hypothetical protein [Siphonobacter sp. SORGH_AS_0500]|uniref:OmpP1/FadL family transporter n=1 Tax=Siphonobacter sp. SORGH_AS_0500 TaxID=1864824 RepID=UPI0028542EBC|nr:hypothetical protein [Siphonobacter sp. SORGH_AS_0500]MDR6194083.1 hypothetical protein [Siphonobacter sp. SORGH_AS_0500]